MKKVTSRLIFLPVLALGWTAGSALAQNGRASCAGRILKCAYAFKTVGLLYNIVLTNGDAPRIAAVGVADFDGQGKFTFVTGVNSFQGFIVPNPPNGFTGTYTLDANCTGTITYFDQLKETIYFVIAEGGAKLFGLYTTPNPNGKDPGPVVTVDFTRQ